MAAIFIFALPDVWSGKDLALRRGLRILASRDQVSEEVVLRHMSPYKSYLALHVWKAMDNNGGLRNAPQA